MNKSDIATRIHDLTGLSEHEAEDVLEWILELLKSTLQQGEDIAIVGFGKFRVRSKHARRVRIPRTGEEMQIPAHRVVTFQASGLLKAYVAGNQ